MTNPARAGVRTFRSGNLYVAVTALGWSEHQYRVRTFTRRGDGPIYFLQEAACGARSAHEAAGMAVRTWATRHPEDVWFEGSDFSKPRWIEVTNLSRPVTLDGLGAFDPKVIRGGRAGLAPKQVLPNNLDELEQWEEGFKAALAYEPAAKLYDTAHGAVPLYALDPPWREGYEAGRRVRGRLWLEEVVISVIGETRRKIQARLRESQDEVEQGLRKLVFKQADAAWAKKFKGKLGPALPYKAVIERFATTNRPAHTAKTKGSGGHFSLWISEDGQTIYSYGQPIARKHGEVLVTVDPRDFSKTTARQQSYLRFRLQHAGWRISEAELSDDEDE